ncbi:MAG: GNAT family N-acetyltransferase [Thermoanaerobaculia bacterium]
MTGDITIRLARETDFADLARLSDQFGYPLTPEAAASRLREVLGGPDHALLVAESDGRVVAWMEMKRLRVFSARRQVELAGLVVDEAHRGQGIGSRLLEEAERWALDLRCGKIRLRSNPIRGRAHDLYRRLGYEEIETDVLFEKQLPAARAKGAKFVPSSIASKSGSEKLAVLRKLSSIAIVRAATAALLIIHGVTRVRTGGVAGFGEFLSQNHLPLGTALAWAITAVEILGGIALAAGRFVRPLCAWFALQLSAGIVLVHGREGWFVVGGGRNGIEYSVLLIVCLLAVAFGSPGRAGAAASR